MPQCAISHHLRDLFLLSSINDSCTGTLLEFNLLDLMETEIDGQKFQIPTVVDMDKFRWGILDLHKMVNEFRAQV